MLQLCLNFFRILVPSIPIALLAVAITCALTAGPVQAGDWPGPLGPTRNAVAAADERLPDRLPARIAPVWTLRLGQGYAGPIVQGDRVYVFHREDGKEVLQAVDFARGQVLWRREFDAGYRGGVDADLGPRCAPVAVHDRVLAFGAAGLLHCVDAADGELRWSRDLYGDYSGDEGYFGAGSCPLIIDDLVLVNVGGRRDAGIVALSLEDGQTRWNATTEAASYSAPVAVQIGGQTRALFATRLNAVMIDPKTGKVLAQRPFGKRGPTVNAASPLQIGEHAFLTASYGVGAALVQLTDDLPAVWQNDATLSSQYNTPVARNGFVYGIHGREDLGPAELRCVEVSTGNVQWAEPNFGVAHVILAGNRLLLVKVDGTLVLAAASPERYQELGRCSLSNRTTRALPALSRGRLFVRDNGTRDGSLMAFDLPK